LVFIVNLIIYLIIKIFLLGLGIGIGFLLHWLLPAVDLGMGILIGVAATAASLHFHTRALNALNEYEVDEDENDSEKEKIYSLDSSGLPQRKKNKK
jgi:hypothetical protein